jgi:hypothetical protein
MAVQKDYDIRHFYALEWRYTFVYWLHKVHKI